LIEFFFPGDQPVALWLNLLIGLLAAGSLLEIFLASQTLWQTEKDLIQASDNTKKLDGHRGSNATAVLRRDLSAGSEASKRLQLLADSEGNSAPIDSEMLAAISAEAFRDAAPVARLATSTLVLLGLAGTLVGLSFAVVELTGALDGNLLNTDEMVETILATLGQMKVAFSTTLAGVSGAMVVGAGLASLRHRQSVALRKLEELTNTKWLPLFQTTEESRLSDVVNEIRMLVTEVESVRDATLEILGERGDESPSLAEYVDSVRQTTQELEKGVKQTSALLPEIQKALEETIRYEHESLTSALTQHTEAVEPLLRKQEAAAQALHEAVSGELKRLVELQGLLGRLSDSFEAAKGTWEEADRAIERMGDETAQAIREGLSEALEGVARLTEQQARSHERMSSVLGDFQRTQEDAMGLLAEQSHRSLNQTREMVDEIRATVRESLERVAQSLVESQRGTGAEVSTGIQALARELRALAGKRDGLKEDGAAKRLRGVAVNEPSTVRDEREVSNGDVDEAQGPGSPPVEDIRRDLDGLK